MRLNAIEKTIKVLQVLDSGLTVKIQGNDYCMDDDNNIGVALYDEKGNENGKMIHISYSINTFIGICDKIPDIDMFSICANKVLSNLNK